MSKKVEEVKEVNKVRLAEVLAESTGISKVLATKGLDAVLAHMAQSLAEGKTVSLFRFGRIGVKKRAARKYINPQTKESTEAPEKMVPFFKPSKDLCDAVSGDA